MKKSLILFIAIPLGVFAAAGDIKISQMNSAGTAYSDHIFTASGATQITSVATLRTAIALGTGDSPQFAGLTTTSAHLIANGTAAAPALAFTNSPTTGLIRSAADAIGVVTAGVERWVFNASGSFVPLIDNTYDIGNGTVNPRDVTIARQLLLKDTGGTSAGGLVMGGDTYLFRGASGRLIFNTGSYAGTELGGISIRNAGNSYLTASDGTRTAIFGTGGAIVIGALTNHPVYLRTNNSDAVTIDISQNTIFTGAIVGQGSNPAAAGAIRLTNNTGIYSRDAGNNGNMHLIGATAGNLVAIAAGGDTVQIGASGAGAAFVQLGGSSALFPAIKRNGTAINFRLANDTGDAPITADQLTTGAPAGGTAAPWKMGVAVTTIGLTASTTVYLQVDVSGTLYKVATFN